MLLFNLALILLTQASLADRSPLPLKNGRYAGSKVLTLKLDEEQKVLLQNLRNCHVESSWEDLNENAPYLFHLNSSQIEQLQKQAVHIPAAFQVYETYLDDKDVANYSYHYWNTVLRFSEDKIEIPLDLLTTDTKAQADHDKHGWKKTHPCFSRFWRPMDDNSAELVNDCSYVSTDYELANRGNCGNLDSSGLLHLKQDHLANIIWDTAYGLACIHVETNKKASTGWYFITQAGLGRKTVSFDNGCLPFQRELALGWLDGKVAYYDNRLNIAHQTDYVWSTDFRTGYAQVCKHKGERRDYLDCGYIDTQMNIIVDTKYPIHTTPDPPKQ